MTGMGAQLIAREAPRRAGECGGDKDEGDHGSLNDAQWGTRTRSEMTIEIRNTVATESLCLLAGLRGATLRRIFGVNLDARLISEDMSLETDRTTITLWGEVDDLGDWEGFEGQYSVLRIDEGVPSIYVETDIAKDGSSDNFFFHAEDRIQDVSIMRDHVRKVIAGEVEWEYITDTAVIFELSRGVLAISQVALDGEALRLTTAHSSEHLTLPPADAFWFHWNVKGTEFLRSSELLGIDDLVDAQGI